MPVTNKPIQARPKTAATQRWSLRKWRRPLKSITGSKMAAGIAKHKVNAQGLVQIRADPLMY